MTVNLKSAYLPCDSKDGTRYLVETLWPEGVGTYDLAPYFWLHELGPSYNLKEMALWKHWRPEEFRDEYRKELQEPHRRVWFDKIVKTARAGTVTLLHRSRKRAARVLPEDTTVYYLKEFLDAALSQGYTPSRFTEAAGKRPPTESTLKQAGGAWENEGGRSSPENVRRPFIR